jgi:hypothetical protein
MRQVKLQVIYEPSPEYLLDSQYDKLRAKAKGLGYRLFYVEYDRGEYTPAVSYTPLNREVIIAEFQWQIAEYPIIFRIGKSLYITKADRVEAVRKQDLKSLLQTHLQAYGDGRVHLYDGLKGVKKLIKYLYPKNFREVWDYLEDEYYYRLTSIKYLHELIKILELAEEFLLTLKMEAKA